MQNKMFYYKYEFHAEFLEKVWEIQSLCWYRLEVIFSKIFGPPPPWSIWFSGKKRTSKIVRTDFFPRSNFGGGGGWYANFASLQFFFPGDVTARVQNMHVHLLSILNKCTFRGPLLLQKVHATDITNSKGETKRDNPKMHVSYVHVAIVQKALRTQTPSKITKKY